LEFKGLFVWRENMEEKHEGREKLRENESFSLFDWIGKGRENKKEKKMKT
jgi:hypothetical protein